MGPVTKYADTIPSADRVASMVHEAIRIAESERPGAVHLELPEDIAEEKTTVKPIISEKLRRPAPDPKAILRAIEIIEKAMHPIVIIAAGANRKLIRTQLKYFLDKTGIPFVTTQMGKGVEDENSKLYIGTTALSKGDFVHKALSSADVIITVGHDIGEKPPIVMTLENHKVVHINFSPADIDDVYVPTIEVVGDVSHTLWAIAEQIKVQEHWDFEYFFKVKNALLVNISTFASVGDFPIRPERIVADIRAVMPNDGILSLDNGMYKIWIARNYPASVGGSVLLDNALATMGAGLSVGISAKLLNPDKKVLVVAGDGGFMMNMAELETAQRLGLDLTILILNDSGFGMIRWHQEEMHLPTFGLDFKNPDFVKLAESFGATGYHISKTEDLLPTLKKALDTKGIHIIDCLIDYSYNTDALAKELQIAITKATL